MKHQSLALSLEYAQGKTLALHQNIGDCTILMSAFPENIEL